MYICVQKNRSLFYEPTPKGMLDLSKEDILDLMMAVNEVQPIYRKNSGLAIKLKQLMDYESDYDSTMLECWAIDILNEVCSEISYEIERQLPNQKQQLPKKKNCEDGLSCEDKDICPFNHYLEFNKIIWIRELRKHSTFIGLAQAVKAVNTAIKNNPIRIAKVNEYYNCDIHYIYFPSLHSENS